MLRELSDMPSGTMGFEAVGEVEDDDWEHVAEPAMRQALADGHKLRVLYVFGPGSDDLEGDAVAAGAEFRTRHVNSFERVAVVSDEDWARPALRMLSLLLPGKAKAFRVSELGPAKAWLAKE
jgi:SpoIIAA-like